MNKEKFRCEMIIHGDTYKTLSEKLGITERTLWSKVNDPGSEFTQSEIALVRDLYSLEDELVMSIFFNSKVSVKTQEE